MLLQMVIILVLLILSGVQHQILRENVLLKMQLVKPDML